MSSVLLTRTSCCKTTHADGYYGAWPGWAVSVSVLSLTVRHKGHTHIVEFYLYERSGIDKSIEKVD